MRCDMSTFLNITLTAALPVIASVVIYILDREAELAKKIPYIYKQVLIGIIFGFIAVLGTEFGVKIEGATVNVRDAAPLCAGLIFGVPSGILAGIIGGIERWFAVYWGAGMYTRTACTVATILAGFFGAGIRRFIFDDKKPTVYYGLVAGLVMEIFHMLLIFLTNMNDIESAFNVVKICSPWMVPFTALSVMFAVFFVSLIGKQKRETHQDLKQISQTFQRWLALVMVVAFLVTTLFSYVLQSELSKSNAYSLLSLNLADVKNDIKDASDENLLKLSRSIAEKIDKLDDNDEADLKEYCKEYGVSEINLINKDGIITHSTYSKFIDYDMRSGLQSAEFMVLFEGMDEYVQVYGPVSFDRTISRKYAGVTLADGGFVQVGYDANNFQKEISDIVKGLTANRHVGEEGHLIIADANLDIVSNIEGKETTSIDFEKLMINKGSIKKDEAFTLDINGVSSYCLYTEMEGYYIIGILPQSEAFFLRDVSVFLTVFM
ncbi:MAG: hypothetical protein E7235_06470, partial [Lachnospiraceae bacterium]|nr:hypothetical protein [Lachnospiraceae bacterium]